MSPEHSSDVKLEIGHVLFIDIVGYSKLLITEQSARLQTLKEIVWGTEQFRQAQAEGKLLRLPTGDGGALVFRNNPEAPVKCAIEISKELTNHPELHVRMGIHSGPVNEITDLNAQANIAGAGINIAQRVMDCGDAGHILLSQHVAEDLEQYPRWCSLLHDIGTFEVKHGVRVNVTNLYSDEVGNPNLPSKLQAVRKHRARTRWAAVAIALLVVAALAAGVLSFLRKGPARSLSTAVEKSLAVLPFENLSKDEENAIFAGGVHREILLDLAKVSELKVISRTSVMQYAAGTARNLKQIARELGVSHVVEGSVQRDQNKVRVTAQLIDAATDTPIWAEAYDRELADVFAIQNEIAQKITAQLGAHLSEKERTALASAPTHDLEAFDLYTKARTLMDTDHDDIAYFENHAKAVPLLESAVKRDPKFVDAYCALSEANTLLYGGGRVKSCAPAESALEEARRIAPDAGEMHFAQALIYYRCNGDFGQALATLELAARSLPNGYEIFSLRAKLEERMGRFEEALRHYTQATELNPRIPEPYDFGAEVAFGLRRYDEGRRIVDAAMTRFPVYVDSYRGWKGLLTLFIDGDIASARRQLENIRTWDSRVCRELAFWVPFVERNYAEAERALPGLADPKIRRVDFIEWDARLAVATKRGNERREAWSPLLAEAAQKVAADPRSFPELRAISLMNAALGNKKEAIEAAKRAVELCPIRQDSLAGPQMLWVLAVVYAWTGEKDLAFETLFTLAHTPFGGVDVGDLKLNPDWDTLRDDPRFNQLLTEAAKPLK
jgi:TolB-like protein/Tfp pilus assembly protein PilF